MRRLSRDEVLERFVGGRDGVTVYGSNDYKSPYASGSAKVDAYVVCPCSMSTVGTLAAGAMANLIHRAASVALKERRKLVLVPRETPLSSIHLRGLATLHEAGAVILFAAPGFYHGPSRSTTSSTSSSRGASISLGSSTSLARTVGPVSTRRSRHARLPEGVRTMFDRIAPVYDVMNRVMTVGLDRRWRRLTAEAIVRPATACSTPAAAPATSRSQT